MFQNHQLYLAEKFNWLDQQVVSTSQKALLQIESLRLIIQSDEYDDQVNVVRKIVSDTLLSPVSNRIVLRKEGFYSANLTN